MKSPEIHLFSDASEGQAPLRTTEFKRDILGRLIPLPKVDKEDEKQVLFECEKRYGHPRKDIPMDELYIWVVQGSSASFPSAIFSSREKAVRWIEKYKISGILSKYPLDISIYDWAITQGLFKPKRDDQKTPGFIQNFSTVHIEDSQYIDGVEEG